MRMVCIGEYGLGNPVYCVEEPTASKMLEVYDKAQPFEPVKIVESICVKIGTFIVAPIQIDVKSNWIIKTQEGWTTALGLVESRKLRFALEAAETWVINHRN